MSPPSPAKPSPLPRSAQYPPPQVFLPPKGVGLGLERAHGPGRRAAFGRAPSSRVPGSSRWRHPKRPVRPGPGHEGTPGSRGPFPGQCGACAQAQAGTRGDRRVLCHHERPSQSGHPGAGYTPSLRLPVPTQNALTKLPRALAAPPHVPAPHSVTLGLRSQHRRPAGHRLSRIPSCSSYTATSGLTPAPHKARPRDPASAPHARSAPARTPARWVPTPRAAPAQVLVPAPGSPLTSEPAVTPGPGVRRCDFAARRPARPWVSGTTAARAGKRVGRGAPSSDLDKAASYPGHRRHHRHHRLALQAACPSPGASGGGTGAPGAGGARSGP